MKVVETRWSLPLLSSVPVDANVWKLLMDVADGGDGAFSLCQWKPIDGRRVRNPSDGDGGEVTEAIVVETL